MTCATTAVPVLWLFLVPLCWNVAISQLPPTGIPSPAPAIAVPPPETTEPAPVRMSYRVRLNVFSGRQDPECEIDDTHPFYDDVFSAMEGFLETDLDDCMGYRGMTMVYRNLTGQMVSQTVGRKTNIELEEALVTHCFKKLDPRVSYYLKDTIRPGEAPLPPSMNKAMNNKKQIGTGISPGKARLLLRVHPKFGRRARPRMATNRVQAPTWLRVLFQGRKKRQAFPVCQARVFDPSNWNYQPIQSLNNCYNYASNIQTDSFAQPGKGGGRKFNRFASRSLISGAVLDGFTTLTEAQTQVEITRGACVIALVIWPGVDFHFYRVDGSRLWSHKRGRTAAKNVDERNATISDPKLANRGPYTDFGTYLGVKGLIHIL